MKVAFASAWTSRTGSGVFQVESALARQISEIGIEINKYGALDVLTESDCNSWGKAKVFAFNVFRIGKFQYMPLLRRRIYSFKPDIIHIHGLWTHAVTLGDTSRFPFRARTLISPHGMMAPDAIRYSSVRKRIFQWMLQERVLDAVDCLHATSEAEYQQIREFGLKQPIAVVPNPVHLPDIKRSSTSCEVLKNDNRRTVLFVGRLHPIKGIYSLISAWSMLESSHPQWRLRIVGASENNYGKELQRHAFDLGCKRLDFDGELVGEEKKSAYESAELYVQPSLSENFSLTVAEALSHCVPVVASRGTPWSGLEENRCGWWVDHGAEPLFQALDRAMRLPRGELEQMGRRGRQWMARDFAAESVALRMVAVYRWLIDGGEPPTDIRLV